MTEPSNLRDAWDVYVHAYQARMADWQSEEQAKERVIAIIEADRAAVEAATIAKVVAWLRDRWANSDGGGAELFVADLIEQEWKQ